VSGARRSALLAAGLLAVALAAATVTHAAPARIVARLPRAGLVVPREHPAVRVRVASSVRVRARVWLAGPDGSTLAASDGVHLAARRARTLSLRLTAAGVALLTRCGTTRVTLAVRPVGGRVRRFSAQTVPDPVRCAPLRWAPPQLQDPQTIALGQGFAMLHLTPGRDYVLRLPPGRKVGGTFVEGGRNVVVIGGHISVPTGTVSDSQRRALYFKDQTGTVHVEGLEIDGSAGGEADAIAINAPQATVQIENVRVDYLHGRQSGTHADVVQPWGGVGVLRIDRLTGSSHFQGLTIPIDQGPIGSASIADVDLHALAPDVPGGGGGDMLWLTREGTCNGYPVQLENVYVTTRANRTIGDSLWPHTHDGTRCAGVQSGATISWPALPVQGFVTSGSPPGGAYVPSGSVGDDYHSPGYLGAAGGGGSGGGVSRTSPAPALLAALGLALALSLLRARGWRSPPRPRSPSRRRSRRVRG